MPRPDWPATQAGAALVKGAAVVLHAPQLAASVFRFASQPLLGSPSQSANLQGVRQDVCNACIAYQPITQPWKATAPTYAMSPGIAPATHPNILSAGSNLLSGNSNGSPTSRNHSPCCAPSHSEPSALLALDEGVGRSLNLAPIGGDAITVKKPEQHTSHTQLHSELTTGKRSGL
jgi:hypothetical protein